MAAAKLDLTVEQGANLSLLATLTDENGAAIDLTSYTAAAQIRQTAASGSILATITCAVQSPTTAGQILMTLTAAQTAALTATASGACAAGKADVWDCLITSGGGTVTKILYGQVNVIATVTR